MLTKREIEILNLKKRGLTQTDIASKLGISQPAVSGFYNNALKKIKEAKEIMEIVKKMKIEVEE